MGLLFWTPAAIVLKILTAGILLGLADDNHKNGLCIILKRTEVRFVVLQLFYTDD